jgi:hypothetical protein
MGGVVCELDGMEAPLEIVPLLYGHWKDRGAATVYRSWEADGGKPKGRRLITYLIVIKSQAGSFLVRGVIG